MGLLDDAIREHLDLKRQRGADPAEVERLEQEALGPVRRAPQDADDELFDDDAAAGPYAAEDDRAIADERDLFDHDSEDEDLEPAEFADPGEFEPPTEIAARPTLEPETDPGLRDSARHHEIAEEWEAQRRESLPDDGFEAEDERVATPPPAPAAPFRDEEQIPPDRREHIEAVEQETAEYHVEDEPEPGEPGEDVLEETPEFLQDTPDHDRLWFEQRPPRDFDLDG